LNKRKDQELRQRLADDLARARRELRRMRRHETARREPPRSYGRTTDARRHGAT
jgi:hypothetical protein